MRYLGIDYGTKRIGLALSDEEGHLAFPREVVDNDRSLFTTLKDIITRENITHIILGESKNYHGEDNPLMEHIARFKGQLEEKTGLPITLEPEFLTSVHAAHVQGTHEKLDASAAAIFLQTYLDRKNPKAAETEND